MPDKSTKSDRETEGYASTPCFPHELGPEYWGLSPEQPQTEYVAKWRTAERKRLISDRLSIPAKVRRDFSKQIATYLSQVIGEMPGKICSFYWPFRGEPDLRDLMEKFHNRGAVCALPCVVKRNSPMAFRTWEPGIEMERGIWNIPVPAVGNEVIPDIVIAPTVGFDKACYRLGNGGGYFDRTLAAMLEKPRIFGVGFSQGEVDTIYPQNFDIPMDLIVTERGTVTRTDVGEESNTATPSP